MKAEIEKTITRKMKNKRARNQIKKTGNENKK